MSRLFVQTKQHALPHDNDHSSNEQRGRLVHPDYPFLKVLKVKQVELSHSGKWNAVLEYTGHDWGLGNEDEWRLTFVKLIVGIPVMVYKGFPRELTPQVILCWTNIQNRATRKHYCWAEVHISHPVIVFKASAKKNQNSRIVDLNVLVF